MMINTVLFSIGSGVIFLWGIAHLAATKSVVNGFGAISEGNRRIIIMEWVGEGLTLCFIGTMVILSHIIACSMNPVLPIIYRGSAIMLVIMAVISAFTGAKTPSLPMRICPFIKSSVAVMFFLGSLL
jgi:hypothetical protein